MRIENIVLSVVKHFYKNDILTISIIKFSNW